MKEVVPGDSVNSLLSILDVITVSDQFRGQQGGWGTMPHLVGWLERVPNLYVPGAAGGPSRHWKSWGSSEGLTAPDRDSPHVPCTPRVTSTPSVPCPPVQPETPRCCGCQWRHSLPFSPSTLRAWCGWCR